MPERTPTLLTDHFMLSACRGDADCASLSSWFADPRIARGFAHRPGGAGAESVASWVTACDGRAALLLAIRERDGGRALGFWHVRADRHQRRGELSVAIGDRTGLGRDAAVETGIALFDWIFAMTATQKLTANVLETNRLARRVVGPWMRAEGRLIDEVLAPDGTGRLTVLRFGLLRHEWMARRAAGCGTPPSSYCGKPRPKRSANDSSAAASGGTIA